MEGLSMSLDDMVKKSRNEKRNWDNKPKKVFKASGSKQNGTGMKFESTDSRKRQPGAFKQTTQKSSILARVGKNAASMQVKSKSGTDVIINVHEGITKKDMLELCQTVGPVGFVSVKDRGSFVAPFDRRSDAVAFIEKYNGKTLDGHPIRARLMVERNAEPQRSFGGGGGGKSSLFGRALGYANNDDDDDDDEDMDDDEEDDDGPHFVVTLGSSSHQGGRNQKKWVEKKPRQDNRQPNNNGGGKKGSGGGFAKKDVTAADLDAELDSYFK